MLTKQMSDSNQNIITVESWTPCAIWSYKIECNTCSICKNKLTQMCAVCVCSTNVLTKGCSVSSGICGHGYHKHCISAWLEKSNSCPADGTPWKYATGNFNSGTTKKIDN